MKHRISFLLVCFTCISHISSAQKSPVLGGLKSDVELAIVGEGGTNNCAVAWNPDMQLYYAVFAGNADYPLETFNRRGELVNSGPVGVDTRSLWYNPKEKRLEGVSFDGGYFATMLDNTGSPISPVSLKDGIVAGGSQSVWQCNSVTGEIYYYSDGVIYSHASKSFKPKSSVSVSGLPCDVFDLNSTSVIFTGYKNYEFGLLDITNYRVHFLNKKGEYTHSIDLPQDAVVYGAFCFSFANDRIWLYNQDTRSWTGYLAFL